MSDTTWLADPDMNFDNVDGWRDDWWHGSPTFTKDGLTVNSRDTRANGKTVGANAAIHVEADADYSDGTPVRMGGNAKWTPFSRPDSPLPRRSSTGYR